ncbi:MAG: hypothetical protein QG591_88 [Planctomycetota bacterium]|nr:hypothetical protein [Planctomycetota bacterium]
MNLSRRTHFSPPSLEERGRNIEMIKWGWFRANEYSPSEPQMALHLSPARYRMAIAGTRGGKSRFAGEEATCYLFAGATRIWIVGQTYALCEKEFRYIYERMTSPQAAALFGGESPLESATYNEKGGDMHIRTKWGAEVKCISLDKAELAALGEEIDLLILSESAQIKKPKYVYERYLRGRLASRQGDLIIPTTPAGKIPRHDPDGWLYTMYDKGMSGEDPEYFARQWASWENPEFKEDPYKLRQEMNPKIFSEQYEGNFVVFSGAIYEDFNVQVHVVPPFKTPIQWRRYESIDPGFSGKWFWLAGVMGYNDSFYVTNEYSATKTRYEDHVAAMLNKREEEYGMVPGTWNRSKPKDFMVTTYIDPEDPQCALELAGYGVGTIPANNDVHVGIDRVSRRLKYSSSNPPRLYISADCKEIIEALQFHSWGEKENVEIRKPNNDRWKHACDCLRYICMGSLMPSERKQVDVNKEETLWEIMMASRTDKKHPFDMTHTDRRGGNGVGSVW